MIERYAFKRAVVEVRLIEDGTGLYDVFLVKGNVRDVLEFRDCLGDEVIEAIVESDYEGAPCGLTAEGYERIKRCGSRVSGTIDNVSEG